jgi:hypothetical protein
MAPVLLSFLTALAVDRGRSRLFLACLSHADLEPRLASGHSGQEQ